MMIFAEVSGLGLGHRGRQGGRGAGGNPHREDELVSRRSQHTTLKSTYHEHDARGLGG